MVFETIQKAGTMSGPREILFEGFTESEILALPKEDIEAMVLTGQSVVFRAGSATVLGQFRVKRNALRIELAQIEGGGEGVLLALATLAKRYAQLNGIEEIEWIVHAVHCAKPNLKLRRVLRRRGFVVLKLQDVGELYHLSEKVPGDADQPLSTDAKPAPHR